MTVDPTPKAIGAAIAELRKRMGMTQRKLAEKVGITPVYLCYIERGNKKATDKISTLDRIAKALGCQLKIRFIP